MSYTKLLVNVGLATALYFGAVKGIDLYFDAKEKDPSTSPIVTLGKQLDEKLNKIGGIKKYLDKKLPCLEEKVEATKDTARNIYDEFSYLCDILKTKCYEPDTEDENEYNY